MRSDDIWHLVIDLITPHNEASSSHKKIMIPHVESIDSEPAGGYLGGEMTLKMLCKQHRGRVCGALDIQCDAVRGKCHQSVWQESTAWIFHLFLDRNVVAVKCKKLCRKWQFQLLLSKSWTLIHVTFKSQRAAGLSDSLTGLTRLC